MLSALLSLINLLRESAPEVSSDPKAKTPPPTKDIASKDMVDLGAKSKMSPIAKDNGEDDGSAAATTIINVSPKSAPAPAQKSTKALETKQDDQKQVHKKPVEEPQKSEVSDAPASQAAPDLFLVSSTGVTSSSDSSDETPTPEPEDPQTTPQTGQQEPPAQDPVAQEPVAQEPAENEDPVTPPQAPEQDAPSSDGGSTAPTDASSNSYDVDGGRVTTLSVENADNVASVQVINGPSHGNLTVNPDNTLALVMSMEPDYSGNLSISYQVTYNDGSTQLHNDSITVTPATQDAGWGGGELYTLQTDENGDYIIETGDDHRPVYVSGSDNALSRSDIAALEGMNTNQITADWLANNPQYGGSEGLALDTDTGKMLWQHISMDATNPTSNWLLFEKGYEYDLGETFGLAGTFGEDPLHPVHITSYGEGDKPVLNTYFNSFSEGVQNLVFSDVKLGEGMYVLSGDNIIFDNVEITNADDGSSENLMGFVIQGFGDTINGFTLHNSAVTDVFRTVHPNGSSQWGEGGLLSEGGYISNVDGLLIEGNLFDHNGWSPDYQYDMGTDGGQIPTMFNHNLYIQNDTTDVTVRDNIIMRGGSVGVQVRGGGFIEDNVFIDNNVGVNFLGGDSFGAGAVGNFSLFADNVITSGGHKEIAGFNGAIARGADNGGINSTLLDNIIAHLADPNNAAEQANKTTENTALINSNPVYYDDTIIHNWLGASGNGTTGVNTDGLDTATLDATTIQIFTQELLGDPNATIGDLANFLRAQAEGDLDHYVDADLIIDFFQTGFGLSVDDRLTPETLRFAPNDLGDGIRWDNRLNWSTDDVPGTVDGDSVDLAGNWVNYGGTTVLEDLDFGEGGTLNVSHGYLRVEDHTAVGEAGAELNVSNAGQIWLDGYTDGDMLEIDVDGGRFANTGLWTGGTDLDVTDGQVLLGAGTADFVLGDGARIDIVGDDAKVGFDGNDGGPSVLLMSAGSTLSFTAEGNNANDLSTIEEFRSGAYDDTPNIQSGANLGGSTLELNLAGWTGEATSTQLLSVDQVIGQFDTINVTGLGGGRDAEVVIDYATDTVTLNITASGQGSGQSTITTTGNENDAQSASALWDALTNGHGIYPNDPAADIPDDEEDDLDLVA